jgi:hypothetical protein
MDKYITILFLLLSGVSFSQQPVVKFACIGDYGKAGTNELNVANLVKSWTPEFIITTGDNNYENGATSTIDANIGQYYHEFIYPYTGGYGSGDTVNRFFPSLGNHDWYTAGAVPYLNYFALPGNERYYDFVKGNIHFFVVDSDPNETDGVDSNSVQGLWLKNALAASTQKWNVVYFHHAAYSSGQHGSSTFMQWPFKRWGASVVLSGHDHTYERIMADSLTYFVNGLGGKSIYSFGSIVSGSQVRYNGTYGAMLINSYNDSMVFKFYSVGGTQRDSYKILPAPKKMALKMFVQGFYNSSSNSMIGDTVRVYLRRSTTPYQIVDSAKGQLSSGGLVNLQFIRADNATAYYVVVKHRNSVETWSSGGIPFLINNMSVDYSTSIASAFGNNMKQVDASPVTYAIFSGDVNSDGIIDAADGSATDNDAFNFVTGYVATDVTGDNTVDASDAAVVDNNAANFVGMIRP